VRSDVTSGLDIRVGSSPFPIYLPANSNLTIALTRDITATGFIQGGVTFSGIVLN
jgi:hypothetical protein